MKKYKYYIASICLVLAGLLVMPINKAFSLYQKIAPSTSFTFKAAEETNFYLVGNFTSWEQQNTYKLNNVTESMTPETNKVAEYSIQNISLNKDDTFKIQDTALTYYDSFAHVWESAVQRDGDGNYKVPITATNYSIYLKLYNDGNSTWSSIYVTATKNVFFLKLNANWKSAGGIYGHLFNATTSSDIAYTQVDENYYKINIPDNMTGLVICRVKTGETTLGNNWSNVWDKSADLGLPLGNSDFNNCICINEGEWSNWSMSSGVTWESK